MLVNSLAFDTHKKQRPKQHEYTTGLFYWPIQREKKNNNTIVSVIGSRCRRRTWLWGEIRVEVYWERITDTSLPWALLNGICGTEPASSIHWLNSINETRETDTINSVVNVQILDWKTLVNTDYYTKQQRNKRFKLINKNTFNDLL